MTATGSHVDFRFAARSTTLQGKLLRIATSAYEIRWAGHAAAPCTASLKGFLVECLISLFLPIQHRGDGGGDGYGQDHADAAGDGADDLQGQIGRTHQLMVGKPHAVQVQNQYEAAAQQRQDQRIGHGPHHVPAHVHAGPEQGTTAQGRVHAMDLPEGGGQAHGHVHDGAQGADDDPAHQQALQADGSPLLAQLQQRLHVRKAQAVDFTDGLGKQAESHGQSHAQNCPQHGAAGLFMHPAQDHEARHADQSADAEHRRDHRQALEKQGNEQIKQGGDGNGQA